MRISHVSCGISDLDGVERRLRERLGLGLWRFPGNVGAHLPLGDRQYIELYTDAHPLWRLGWIAWSVAVEELDAWVARLRLADCREFGGDPAKTFTPWHGRLAGTTASRQSGGLLPYLIEYDPSVDLDAVFAAKHRVAGHAADVGAIRSIMTDGKRIDRVSIGVAGVEHILPLP